MGHVYLLKANIARQPIYKIGMTDRANVDDRVNEISQEWWDKRKVKVLFVKSIEVQNASAVEAQLHRLFSDCRLFGQDICSTLNSEWLSGDSEWFKFAKAELRQVEAAYDDARYQSTQYEPEVDNDRHGCLSLLPIGLFVAAVVGLAIALGQGKTPVLSTQATTIVRANVRSLPNGKIICTLQAKQAISISGSGEWLPTSACGGGVVHRSVVEVKQ